MNESRIEIRPPALFLEFASDDSPGHVARIDELITLHADEEQDEAIPQEGQPEESNEWPTIPDYEILGPLGQGGMGVVYRALHLGLKRPVALKILRHADRPSDLHRFRREAELAARLQHPHIVQVFEVGFFRTAPGIGECPYIAFEFVSGGGLDRLLQTTVLRPVEAANLLRTLARTLQAVHDQGIVHRDLKPANLLFSLSRDAESSQRSADEGALRCEDSASRLNGLFPKITDFGLACLHEEVGGGLTRPGQLLGTPGYMAPEQVDGLRRTIGPAADIHALGAILYETLTGRSPYKGASLHETLALICGQEAVPVRRLRPDVPRDLETICLKCLEKEPENRYRSAAELADDLQRFLDGRPILARSITLLERGWRWCRRQPALAALAASCALLCVVLLAGTLLHVSHLAAARSEAETAREVAATQEYYALLNAVRERASRREMGWVKSGLADISRATDLNTRAVDRRALRTEATSCLAGVDLRLLGTIATPVGAARMAFHPSRPLLALGEAKGWLVCAVVLVDIHSGQAVRHLALPSRRCWNRGRPVQDGVTALAFSPNGRWCVAGTRSGWLHRWDLNKDAPRTESWTAHKERITDLLFAAHDDVLFSSGDDRTLRRWSLCDSRKQTHHVPLAGRIAPGAVPGTLLVVDQQIHTLRQEDLKPTVPPVPFRGYLVRACAGGPLAVAVNATLQFVDGITGRVTQTLRSPGREEAHVADIDFIDCCHDMTALVSASRQTRRVRVWEIAGGRLLADLPMGENVAEVAFAPRERTLAVLTGHEIRLYELANGDVQTFSCLHTWPVLACAWLGNDRGLACLAGDRVRRRGEVTLWSAGAGAQNPRWRSRTALPMTRLPVRLHADAAGHVAWTEGDGMAVTRSDRPGKKWTVSPGELQSLAFAPDGRLWCAAGCKIESRTMPQMKTGPGWDNSLGDMISGLGNLYAVAPGRKHVLVGGRDGCLRLLDARTGQPVHNWKICTTPICSVALSGDEEWGLAGTTKGGVKLVRIASKETIELPAGHRDCVKAVAFVGKGLFASGSSDRTLKLWRLDGDTPEEWLNIPTGRAVKALAPSPDGTRLAVVLLGDRAVHIWNLDRLRKRLADLGLE